MSSVTGQAIGSGPAHSPCRSAPEKAATTPGIPRALERSTRLIRAWAKGLRTTAIQAIPGRAMSSTYLARPVRNSGSSFLGTSRPT